jgi:hypothetical protein
VNVRVVFYNHTQGPLGEKTYDGMSGDRLAITIRELGYSGIDSNRIVVRKAAAREAMGELLYFSKSGVAYLEYPDSNETWEAYLMNIGTDYQLADMQLSGKLESRVLNWYRRDWDATGPEEPITEAFRQFNDALDHQWKKYGEFVKEGSGIRVDVGYGLVDDPLALAWICFSSCDTMYIKVDPTRCPSNANKVSWFVQSIFKLSTGAGFLLGAGIPDVSRIICDEQTGALNTVGRDLFAYAYVRDQL